MRLSEDEQRRLDEIERALYRDDPKFAAGQSIERFRRRRMVMAGAAVLACECSNYLARIVHANLDRAWMILIGAARCELCCDAVLLR